MWVVCENRVLCAARSLQAINTESLDCEECEFQPEEAKFIHRAGSTNQARTGEKSDYEKPEHSEIWTDFAGAWRIDELTIEATSSLCPTILRFPPPKPFPEFAMFTNRHLFEWALFAGVLAVVGGTLLAETGRIRSDAAIQQELSYYRTQAAIELFAHQHQGQLPDSLEMLVVRTDSLGNPNKKGRFGPYLNRLPGDEVEYSPAGGLTFAK